MIRYAWGRKSPAIPGKARDASQDDHGFCGGRSGHPGHEAKRGHAPRKGDPRILNTLFV